MSSTSTSTTTGTDAGKPQAASEKQAPQQYDPLYLKTNPTPASQIPAAEIKESSDPSKDLTSTDTPLRYGAYFNRFRTILMSASRYVAYTSDVGESFRPVAHPYLVKFGYAVSWSYVLGDVGYETWRARMRQQGSYYPGLKPWTSPQPEPNPVAAADYNDLDWKVLGVKRALFQSIASMGLPAFTIHSTVKYSARLFKDVKNPQIRTWGPVACGLAVVPVLPFLFDKPVEEIIDKAFYSIFPRVNGAPKKLE